MDRALIETELLLCALSTLGAVGLWYGGRRFENTLLHTMCLRGHNDTVVECAFVS